MIRFVLLDLDDTILDFGYSESVALQALLREHGLEPTEELVARYSAINESYWKRLETGELTRFEVQTGRFAQLFSEMGVEADAVAANDRYKELVAGVCRYIDGAEKLLADLRAAGYALYVVSNGSVNVQKGRMHLAGLDNFFDGVFLSEQIGAEKPSAEFFDYCFARIPDFDPKAAIIVGDSLTSDIKGGLQAGILTCWFNPKGKVAQADIRPDFQISALHQLTALPCFV